MAKPDIMEIPRPSRDSDVNVTVDNIFRYIVGLEDTLAYMFRHIGSDNVPDQSLTFDKLSGGSIDLTGEVAIKGEKETTILDEFGLDTRFIKWGKNFAKNSSFEIFDATTLIPKYWSAGVVTSGSNFFGTYSMKLAPAQTTESSFTANPTWWNSISKFTRVSFHKKLGATTITVYDQDDTAIEITNQDGNYGTSLEFEYNGNWVAESYSINFAHGDATNIKVQFENTDGTYDCYLDGLIIEADYTRKRPSFYSDGPYSLGYANGLSSSSSTVYEYRDSNASAVEVTTSETEIATKTITLTGTSDIYISFSAEVNPTSSLRLTAKTYLDEATPVARTYQPIMDVYGTGNYVFTYSDIMKDVSAGDVTVSVSMLTDADTVDISANFGVMSLIVVATGLDTVYEDVETTTITEAFVHKYSGTENGTNNTLLKISDTLLLHLFLGTNSRNNIFTYGVGGSYELSTVDSLAGAFYQSQRYQKVLLLDDTHYVMAFSNYVGYPYAIGGYLQTFTIDALADNITMVDSLGYISSRGYWNSLAKIDSTHFIWAYMGDSDDGYIGTYSVDANADNITAINTLEHDTGNGTYNSLVMIDSTHFILAYAGSGSDGHIKTFSIDGSYNITEEGSLEHDTGNGTYNSLVMIDSTHFILAYTSDSTTGYIKTFSIDGSYAITEIDSLQHEAASCSWNSLTKLDSTHYALAYTGVDDDGYIKVFKINGAYSISQTGVIEQETDYAAYNSIVAIDSTHIALAYNYGINRTIKTFTLS